MPPLVGFSDNDFRTRSDLIRAGLALLRPLEQYKSPDQARIKLATASGAGFSETAAQLEGFARPLWLVSELTQVRHSKNDPLLSGECGVNFETWVTGLKNGVDPESTEYWGDLGDFDQRMVEMESIAYSLLVCPSAFGFSNDSTARRNLVSWLRQINSRVMPQNNWRWFRVFVNLALVQTLGVAAEEVQEIVDQDLEVLDSFYLGGGWSSDGLWGEDRKQADYYSGSFAIQFAQLLYLRLAQKPDQERVERYRSQAREFAAGFWRYFDLNGAAIPFGRSLTYRFAFAAFWSAAATAGVGLAAPLDKPGAVKGMLLRHLRWWAQQPDIFNTDGTVNIGFRYPNMYISEDYNSPQSVYWCLKSFIVAGLSEDSEFWTSEELPHPLESLPSSDCTMSTIVAPPRHILVQSPEHHFLLASEQMSKKNHKSREAKYAKFAYSSAFGFSVSIGPLLEQIAPDSTICLSIDGGDSWHVHWEAFDVEIGHADTQAGPDTSIPTLSSKWRPLRYADLEISTTLVSPTEKHRGWHLRLHQIRWKRDQHEASKFKTLRVVDSGFAISAQTSNDVSVWETPCRSDDGSTGAGKELLEEGWWSAKTSCLLRSSAGTSGIVDLTREFVDRTGTMASSHCAVESQSKFIKADANTNLMAQRTLIPAAEHSATYDHDGLSSFSIVTGVFAVTRSAEISPSKVEDLWRNRPVGKVEWDERGRAKLCLC